MGLISVCMCAHSMIVRSFTWAEKPSQNLDTIGKGKSPSTHTHSAMSKLSSYVHLYPDGLSE